MGEEKKKGEEGGACISKLRDCVRRPSAKGAEKAEGAVSAKGAEEKKEAYLIFISVNYYYFYPYNHIIKKDLREKERANEGKKA